MASKHDRVASRIAGQQGTDYNRGKGPDVIASKRVIEVETENTIQDGFRQLQGFKKPVYIAGADGAATKKALEKTQGTTVGVMDPNGHVLRRSSRKRGK